MRELIKGKMIEDCVDELKVGAVLEGSKLVTLVKGTFLLMEILDENDPMMRKIKKRQLDVLLFGAEIMKWAFPQK